MTEAQAKALKKVASSNGEKYTTRFIKALCVNAIDGAKADRKAAKADA